MVFVRAKNGYKSDPESYSSNNEANADGSNVPKDLSDAEHDGTEAKMELQVKDELQKGHASRHTVNA